MRPTELLISAATVSKKIAAGVPSIESFRHRRRRFAFLGVFLNFCLAVFQFLKLVVPSAFFTEDFGVALHFRAVGFSGLRIKYNILALQLELMGFEFIIGIFDKKIQAAAYGALHFTDSVWFLVFDVGCLVLDQEEQLHGPQTKHKIRNTKHLENFVYTNSSILIYLKKRLLFSFADRAFIRRVVFTGVTAHAANPVVSRCQAVHVGQGILI